MKIIKSQSVPPRQQVSNVPVQQPVQNPVQQPVVNTPIIQNKEPLNRQLLKQTLMKFRNNITNLMGNIDKFTDNDLEIQIAQIHQNFQLLVKSLSEGRRKTQITPQQEIQQTKQIIKNAPR